MKNKIEKTSGLFDFSAMEKDIQKSRWHLLNLDTQRRTIMMTQPQILEYINKSLSKNFTLEEIDHKRVIAHNDVAFMILRDAKGDLK